MKLTRRKVHGIIGAALIAGLAVTTTACSHSTGAENAQQNRDSNAILNNQPLPYIPYSQERQNLIDIEIAEANNVVTTSFATHQGNQDPIWSGPTIGFGIPDSSSLSNPHKVVNGQNGTSDVVDQMDPNGIYVPTSTNGTFIIALMSDGTPYINRFEDNVDTIGGPATWNYSKHIAQLTGAPTAAATATHGVHGK